MRVLPREMWPLELIDDEPRDPRPYCRTCLCWLTVRISCATCSYLFCSDDCRRSKSRHACVRPKVEAIVAPQPEPEPESEPEPAVVQTFPKCGHPKTPENTRFVRNQGSVYWRCDACLTEYGRAWARRRRGEPKRPRFVEPGAPFPCGHPRTPENCRTRNRGCRPCFNAYMRDYNRRVRAVA